MGLDARLKLARLAVIAFADADKQRTVDLVDAVLGSGADMLQLRLDHVAQANRQKIVEAARSIAFQHPTTLLVLRDDVAVATAMQADALHLSEAATPTSDARRALSQDALVGRSAHDVPSLDRALADPGVAYATLGPVVQAADAQVRSGGLDMVREAAQHHAPGSLDAKPWFAQGGITLDTLDDVVAAGARRVCVGQAVAGATDVVAATRAFADRMTEVWHGDQAMQDYVRHGIRPSLAFEPGDQRG